MTFTVDDIKERSQMFGQVVAACRQLLYTPQANSAREYIEKRIGKKACLDWEVGYFPPDSHLHQLQELLDPNLLEKLFLIYPKYINGSKIQHGHFDIHNIVMPFKDEHDNIVSILGRSLLSKEELKSMCCDKYKYSFDSFKGQYVFGLSRAKENIISTNCVVCVEGQFDCIACHKAGLTNVVALGCADMSRIQFFKLRRYVKNIILMLDNDESGTKNKKRLKRRFNNWTEIKSVLVPGQGKYKDFDEFFLKESDEAYVSTIIDNMKKYFNKVELA